MVKIENVMSDILIFWYYYKISILAGITWLK